MKRTLAAGVIGMTLTVTGTSLADPAPAAAPTAPSAPAAPAAAAPSAPAPAAVTPPSAPAAPAVTAAAAAPAARPAPAPAAAAPAASYQAAAAAPAASAQPAAPAAATPAPAASAAAPAPAPAASSELPLRTPQPLTLAAEPSGTSWGVKLAFVAAIAAAGFVVYRRRRRPGKEDPRTAVKVIGKTTMGLRGELALVEVGGMRLLVGVTPSSMQTLAVLSDEAETEEPAPVTEEKEQKVEIGTRARSLLAELEGTVSRATTIAAKTPAAAFSASRYEKARSKQEEDDDAPESAPQPPRERRRSTREREIAIEGQARGISLALRGVK